MIMYSNRRPRQLSPLLTLAFCWALQGCDSQETEEPPPDVVDQVRMDTLPDVPDADDSTLDDGGNPTPCADIAADDADGDGVDGCEELPPAPFCVAQEEFRLHSWVGLQLRFLLPPDWTAAESNTGSLVTITNPGESVFGWVSARPPAQSPEDAQRDVLEALGSAGFRPQLISQTAPFETWSLPEAVLEPGIAMRSRLRLVDNTDSLGTVRNEFLAALATDEPIDSPVGPEECEEVVVWLLTLSRGNSDVLLGAMACGGPGFEEELQPRLELLTDATHLAPLEASGEIQPWGSLCETLEPPLARSLDMLMVVNNRWTMADEQMQLLEAAPGDQLNRELLDWRLAATTTETWGLDPMWSDQVGDLDYDNQLHSTGLRGPGFFSAADEFWDYVVQVLISAQNCSLTEEPDGLNLCGSSLSSGLESALVVLGLLQEESAERYSLRENVPLLLLWLSDTDDVRCAEGNESAESYIQRYLALGRDHFACSIVGDLGVGGGGACEPPMGSNGAEQGTCYQEVTRGLGGRSSSICQTSDFGKSVEACQHAALHRFHGIELARTPIRGSLAVSAEGIPILEGTETGWTWSPETNTIVFHGIPEEDLEFVEVGYRYWRVR